MSRTQPRYIATLDSPTCASVHDTFAHPPRIFCSVDDTGAYSPRSPATLEADARCIAQLLSARFLANTTGAR